jgi:hypothetical protein
MGGRTATTLFLAATFAIYCPLVLATDTATSAGQQAALGLTTWAFLFLALRLSPPSERTQVISMVAVATCFECVGSLLLGAYRYRLDNLPLYVPPGHGLFFLVAVRVAGLPWVGRYRRMIVASIFVGSALLVGHGLFLLPVPDVFGLGTWIVLLPYLLRSRYPVLYAISFTMTMALEYYGTALGNWAWAPTSPLLGIPAANPPAAIGVGYCIMDNLARLLAPRLEQAVTSLRHGRYRAITVPRMLEWMLHI